MAKYTDFKKRRFPLKKEARAWAVKIKKEWSTAGQILKIETNYISSTGEWEGVVLRKL